MIEGLTPHEERLILQALRKISGKGLMRRMHMGELPHDEQEAIEKAISCAVVTNRSMEL